MINTFVGVGRTTKDIDLRYSQSGVAVANFTLAITRRFDKDNADFIRCIAFKKTAELLAQYVKKGHQLGVEGSVQTGSYENNQGQTVFTTEVIVNNMQFLESRNSGQQSAQQQNTGNYTNQSQQTQQMPKSEGQQIDIDDSDLPF